ncbi:MAG: L,D-transpeptidase family protein [Clostridia bacterium]|nr:L,D-transpeptidase family protein [Clostridia bacterium]
MKSRIRRLFCLPLAMLLMFCTACSSSDKADANSNDNSLTATVTTELHAPIQVEQDSPDWIKNLPTAKDESVKQMVVVAAMGEELTTATISMHERAKDGSWKQIMTTPGFVGRTGVIPDAERKAGTGKTPMGVYRFTQAFGIAPDPGCKMPYVQVDEDKYWSGDYTYHPNEMVSLKEHPELDTEHSEHLIEYEYQYQYCLNIGFNEEGIEGRGDAIFLHCIGNLKPYTGGCVAMPEYAMKFVMQHVEPDCKIVIDLFENMGGSF